MIETDVFGPLGEVVVLCCTAYLVYYYAQPNMSWLVRCIVLLGWLLSFTPIVLIPADLTLARHRKGDDPDNKPLDNPTQALWAMMYWLSFCMTWVVLPVLTDYINNGHFEAKTKLVSSVKRNGKTYAIMGVLAVTFIIVLLISSAVDFADLPYFIICTTNTIGLVMAAFLLGYGLVEVPRMLWKAGNRSIRLKQCQYRLATVYGDYEQAKEDLHQATDLLLGISARLSAGSHLRVYLAQIQTKMPRKEDYDMTTVSVNHLELIPVLESLSEKLDNGDLDEQGMVDLHKYVIDLGRRLYQLDSEWTELVETALETEKLMAFQKRLSPPEDLQMFGRWKWKFVVAYQPRLWQVLSVICGILSLLLLWDEVTAWTQASFSTSVSIFHLVIQDTNSNSTLSLLFFAFGYFTFCCYYPLFSLSISNVYGMHPRRRTDASTLLTNSGLLLRLCIPLSYNFVLMTHSTRNAEHQLGLEQFIGDMAVIPFFGSNDFTSYFPVLIFFLAAATLFNVFGKILKCLGVPQFEARESFEADQIAEGRLLLRKEKMRQGYHAESTSRSEFMSSPGALDDAEETGDGFEYNFGSGGSGNRSSGAPTQLDELL